MRQIMSLGRIIIASIIAGIAIFAVSVIQNQIIILVGWQAAFTGSVVFVAPAIIGAVVFVAVLGKLHTVDA
jgi:hypothetical protein